MNWSKIFPGAMVFVTALYFIGAMIPAGDAADGFQFTKFGRLPVVDGGRVKPIDTFARTNLMVVSEWQSYKEFDKWQDYLDDDMWARLSGERKTKTVPAVKWFLDTLAFSEPMELLLRGDQARLPPAYRHRVFRIENDQVLNFLELEPRPGFYRYSMMEIMPRFEAFYDEAARILENTNPKEHDLYQSKITLLHNRIRIFQSMMQGNSPLLVPPRNARNSNDWTTLRECVYLAFQDHDIANPALKHWLTMLLAYRKGDVDGFNKSLDEYSKVVADVVATENAHVGLEVFYNNFNAFKHCAIVYGLMFGLACLSWVVWTRPLNRAVFWTLVLVTVVHTWALVARMVIQGRPPVTNLYSTAIFIGWTSVITCLFAERYFRNGLSLAVGSLIGLCTLIIAHYWSLDGDTLEMMQAVLDTNFWLATHVTSINFGYSATIVAGFMGVAYIVLGLFTPRLANGAYVELGKATYGFICFAMFLSFIGTVLGGIWADQSWGRFWGWDTKENGALLIVIWNALILHARWAGLVKQRGMAVLAVFGNIITAWSWVGTNQLGVGLHSYGSTNGVLMVMLAFDGLMLLIMLLGLIPLPYWVSFRPNAAQAPPAHTPVAGPRSQSIRV